METLRRALADVEQDLRASESELERLSARVQHLRQAAAGLRGLVAESPDGQAAERKESASPDAIPSPKHADKPTLSGPTPLPALDDTVPDSFDGVRAILREHAGRNVHIDEVRKEFRERGWIRSDWANPDSAIYAALVRASTRDEHVERTARRTWRYSLRPDGADRPEGENQEGASQEDIEQ